MTEATVVVVDKSKALEDSLYNLLLPVAEECNTHIDEIAATQKMLADQIEKLVVELERLKALTQCPTAFSPYSKKLIACRNRVDNASRALTAVETRVTRMTVGLRKLQPQVFENQYQKEKKVDDKKDEVKEEIKEKDEVKEDEVKEEIKEDEVKEEIKKEETNDKKEEENQKQE